jgi:4-amino-4-deoxy-L-arabinose transferase-like glycosyltransferase
MLARVPAPAWIVLVWAAAALPSASVRSFIWEEGTNALLARDILARGELLRVEVLGVPWVDKPPLLAWMVAGVARLTGQVDEWSARLPAMVVVLLTALLVERLTRRYAGTPGSLFAAVCFLLCPLVLRKIAIAEPDTIVTGLSFAAFVLWWRGEEAGHVSGWRWLGCGALLAVATMGKGPQPIGFFALGVAGYHVWTRRLRPSPGLVLCLALPAAATLAWGLAVYRPDSARIWIAEMRLRSATGLGAYLVERVVFNAGLLADLLPGVVPLFVLLAASRRRCAHTAPPPVVVALALYAGLAALALAVWPGARTRYAMPAAPAVAALAGLAFERLRVGHPARRLAVALAAVFLVYEAAAVWVPSPVFADPVDGTRRAARALDAALDARPGPVFALGRHCDEFFYMSHPIRWVVGPHVLAIHGRAWLVASELELEALGRIRPDLSTEVALATTTGHRLRAVWLEARPRP